MVGSGPPIIRIDGGVYHLFSDRFYPKDQEKASFSHLYVIDEKAANSIRQKRNPKAKKELIRIITDIIETNNPYAKSYSNLRRKELENKTEEEIDEINYKLSIIQDEKNQLRKGTRRYDPPSA
jgi:hypothetical protein